jgi:hypothetical protein
MSFGNTWRKIGDIKFTCGWLHFEIYHVLGKTPMLQLKVTMDIEGPIEVREK